MWEEFTALQAKLDTVINSLSANHAYLKNAMLHWSLQHRQDNQTTKHEK